MFRKKKITYITTHGTFFIVTKSSHIILRPYSSAFSSYFHPVLPISSLPSHLLLPPFDSASSFPFLTPSIHLPKSPFTISPNLPLSLRSILLNLHNLCFPKSCSRCLTFPPCRSLPSSGHLPSLRGSLISQTRRTVSLNDPWFPATINN